MSEEKIIEKRFQKGNKIGPGRQLKTKNAPRAVRATVELMIRMRYYTHAEIRDKILELYSFKVTKAKMSAWLQPKAREVQKGKEKFAHPSILSQYVMLNLKEVMINKSANLMKIKDHRELDTDLNTLMKFVKQVNGMDIEINDVESVRPNEKAVVEGWKNFLTGQIDNKE